MMKKIICLCLASLLTLSLIGCNANGDNSSSISNGSSQETESSGGQAQKPEAVKGINAVSPYQDEYVFLTNEMMTDWLKNYTYASAQPYSDMDKSFTNELYYPRENITLSWNDTLNCDYYVLLVDTNENMSSADMYQVIQPKKSIAGLLPSTEYYWKVIGFKGEEKATVSNVFHFTTVSTPRTIKIEGLSNTRDIGGYMTSFGKKVNYGLVYRCGGTENTTDLGRAQIAQYGIKTEIDLRGVRAHYEGWGDVLYNAADKTITDYCVENGSWLGQSITYKVYWSPFYAYNDATSLNDVFVADYHSEEMAHFNDKQIVNILKEFANESNYPIIFHCSAGRDRTGTVAGVLSALLGVSEEDLYIDYETSFFAYVGSAEKPNVAGMISNFSSILNYLYTFEGTTLADKTANYLMTYGMTQQEIDTIREIMLED